MYILTAFVEKYPDLSDKRGEKSVYTSINISILDGREKLIFNVKCYPKNKPRSDPRLLLDYILK